MWVRGRGGREGMKSLGREDRGQHAWWCCDGVVGTLLQFGLVISEYLLHAAPMEGSSLSTPLAMWLALPSGLDVP